MLEAVYQPISLGCSTWIGDLGRPEKENMYQKNIPHFKLISIDFPFGR
jgi:hypothetical protein